MIKSTKIVKTVENEEKKEKEKKKSNNIRYVHLSSQKEKS